MATKRKFLFGDQSVGDQLEPPMISSSLDISRETLPQQALKQAMTSQTNTEQIQPKADPENLDSAGQTKPSLFQPTTKQKWLGYDEPNKAPLDEYGLEKPKIHHEGYLSKIAGIGLPALIGLAGGAGLAPGLFTGFLGERGREAAGNKIETQAYNTARASAYQADKLQKELDLRGKTLDETIRSHDLENSRDLAKIGIEREKAARSGEKPLSSEAAKTLTLANGALRNIGLIRDKVNSGSNMVMTSVLDRDLDAMRNDLKDQIGRLRSGGAIGVVEGRDFEKLIPGPLDSKKTKINKLNRLEQQFSDLSKDIDPSTGVRRSLIAPTQAPSTSSKTRTTKSGLQYEVE